MKICSPAPSAHVFTTRVKGNGGPGSRRDEQGLAVITVMTVLAIVLICLAGNIRMLYSLERELKLVEKQQTRRLQAATPAASTLVNTNLALAQTNSPSK